MTSKLSHGCRKCAVVNKGFTIDSEGYRRCVECMGQVLTLQEAFDLILALELQNEVGEDAEGFYEN